MKQSSQCLFVCLFVMHYLTQKMGLRFLMKCIAKMENVFTCGRLMVHFACKNFCDQILISYLKPCM